MSCCTFTDRGGTRCCCCGDFKPNPEDERAKSEAILEQAEELDMVKAELAAYREVMAHMTPEAQLVAAFQVNGGYDEAARRVLETWKKLRNIHL